MASSFLSFDPKAAPFFIGLRRDLVALKRRSDEDILELLRECGVKLASVSDVPSAYRGAGINDATYYNCRRRFGGTGKS